MKILFQRLSTIQKMDSQKMSLFRRPRLKQLIVIPLLLICLGMFLYFSWFDTSILNLLLPVPEIVSTLPQADFTSHRPNPHSDSLAPLLNVTVTNTWQISNTVMFYGRVAPLEDTPDFTIVTLPDTQHYTCGALCGSDEANFLQQTAWIVNHCDSHNIVFVTHVGDVVEFGGLREREWECAERAMHSLETYTSPAMPDGIPYGISPGNHDQRFGSKLYEQYFGYERFEGRAYYGGHYADNNQNSYQLFSVGALDFIVVHLGYDPHPDQDVLDWADELLTTYADRKAIVVTHSALGWAEPGFYSWQGQAILDTLDHHPNFSMLINGHYSGEGYRVVPREGHPLVTMRAEYAWRPAQEGGWMRLLRFLPRENRIEVKTYSPILGRFERDADSEFSFPYNLQPDDYTLIGQVSGVTPGEIASMVWEGLESGVTYDWYVEITTAWGTVPSPVWQVTIGE